jgi:hypothetical protein
MRGQGAAPVDANSAAPAGIDAPQGQRGFGMRGQMGQGGGAGMRGQMGQGGDAAGARRGGARGGARGGGGMGGFNMANQIFRAIRIPINHPGLEGKELKPIEEEK